MTYSDKFRWRTLALMHVYDVSSVNVTELFGPKQQTLCRWYALFLNKGIVSYVETHPTFYIEELREFVIKSYPTVTTATICRVLSFDLNLSRRVLSKVAREATPAEFEAYRSKLLHFFLICSDALISESGMSTKDMSYDTSTKSAVHGVLHFEDSSDEYANYTKDSVTSDHQYAYLLRVHGQQESRHLYLDEVASKVRYLADSITARSPQRRRYWWLLLVVLNKPGMKPASQS
ncbi:hypothetical protein GN958_ATG01416 [Phytophthora infestans]|uniref:Transposase n=1 Tax=Phytophthora infestans TaxID=4787 RepID=A0A8S9VDE5_PHYIN|nr:hypothetical protein GN958_ATG01416 [Phytophthora infestans]